MQNIEKEKRIAEQYTCINDIIVTGLHRKPRSYACAVSGGGEEHSKKAAHSIEQQVTTFLLSKGIKVNNNNIESCLNLPQKNKTGNSTIIIGFVNRKHTMELLK